jgi:hypothetical protein
MIHSNYISKTSLINTYGYNSKLILKDFINKILKKINIIDYNNLNKKICD